MAIHYINNQSAVWVDILIIFPGRGKLKGMKKVVFAILFVSLIFVGLPSKVLAASCDPQSSGRCGGSTPTLCAVNGAPYCCTDRPTCNTYRSNSPGGGGAPTTSGGSTTTTGGGGGPSSGGTSDPTCNGGAGIATAIGCIRFDSTENFVGDLLKWAVGIGGGIAFLLIIYAGFMIMTSTGDPKRLQAGQELLVSAIGGLILLVLSIFILNVIGINVLRLDKFGL